MKNTVFGKISIVFAALLVLATTLFTTGCNNKNGEESTKTNKNDDKHLALVDYIKEEGEFDEEYNEYSINTLENGGYMYLDYSIEDKEVNAGVVLPDGSSVGHIYFEGVSNTYSIFATVDTDYGTMIIGGEVKAGVNNLQDNYDKYITIDYISVDGEMLDGEMLEGLSDTAKSLLATTTTNVVFCVDSALLEGSGFSIAEIYNLPTA